MISAVGNNAYASSMMRSGIQRPPSPPDPDELFAKTDANGDGTIDKVELSDALASLSEPGNSGNTPDADELFSMLDADGDGSITEEEHTQGLKKLGPQGGPQGGMGMMGPPPPPPNGSESEEDLFSATDTDGNGTIDLEELSSKLNSLSGSADTQSSSKVEELFSMLDADGDGAITSEEHRQGLEEMESARQERRPPMVGMLPGLMATAIQRYQFSAMDYTGAAAGANLNAVA